MALVLKEPIDEGMQAQMRLFYGTLSERDQRRYAALEARRFGHGGVKHVSEILGCSTRTITRGLNELDILDDDPAEGRVRREGGGRKKVSRRTIKSS